MKQRLAQFLSRLHGYVDRPWYFPLVGFLGVLDQFILILPTDAIVMTTVLVRPRRWVRTALWMAAGTTVGAVGVALLVRAGAPWVMQSLLAGVFNGTAWKLTEGWIRDYGPFGLAFSAITPIPQQIPIALSMFAQMPLGYFVAAALIGRLTRYAFFGWAASHAPRLLQRAGLLTKLQ